MKYLIIRKSNIPFKFELCGWIPKYENIQNSNVFMIQNRANFDNIDEVKLIKSNKLLPVNSSILNSLRFHVLDILDAFYELLNDIFPIIPSSLCNNLVIMYLLHIGELLNYEFVDLAIKATDIEYFPDIYLDLNTLHNILTESFIIKFKYIDAFASMKNKLIDYSEVKLLL